jgi:hypothetical protein
MQLGLYYRCIVTDKNGKIVKRTHWRKSRSFVIQFLQLLSALNQATSKTIVDVTEASQTAKGTLYENTSNFVFRALEIAAPDDNADYGIVVGTGTTSPTNTDRKLVTKIAHGTGAGQLDYGAHNFTNPAVVGANVDYVISRSFYNGSGASITVNEIGIYARYYASVAGQYYTFYACIVRDVITPITVANTQTLTVQYTIRTTV